MTWEENFRDENFPNLAVPPDVVLFLEIFENAVSHLLLEVAENSSWRFLLNGKRPLVCYTEPFLESSRNALRDDTKNRCVAD